MVEQRTTVRRRIGIVGSGHAGLLAGHALRQAGHEVTLYSDRTADDWLWRSRPTGTAARFASALAFERALGCGQWEPLAPKCHGVMTKLYTSVDNRMVTWTGRCKQYYQSVDLRLQSHRWLLDLEAAGAEIVIDRIDPDKLDAVSARHDLVLVASGRGALAELFPRDVARCDYDAPQRKLCMVIATGAPLETDGLSFLTSRFSMLAPHGELAALPFYHRDHGPCWCVVFEAKPGAGIDRFDGCTSGEQALAIGREIVRELLPAEYGWFKDLELADPLGWLVGAVTPTVRAPLTRLPSGRLAMAVGDALISVDPLAGQGANLGNKYVQHIVASVAAAPDARFDAAWIGRTFDGFWAEHGAPTVALSSCILEPPNAAYLLLVAQCGSTGVGDAPCQRIADAMVENYADPRRCTGAFLDPRAARALIAELAGGVGLRQLLGGAARIASDQLRRVLAGGPAYVALAS